MPGEAVQASRRGRYAKVKSTDWPTWFWYPPKMNKILLFFLVLVSAAAAATQGATSVADDTPHFGLEIREKLKIRVDLLEEQISALQGKLDFISEEMLERYGIYVVQPGDTFSSVARRFGTTQSKLIALNPHVKDPRRLQVALLIRIRECD